MGLIDILKRALGVSTDEASSHEAAPESASANESKNRVSRTERVKPVSRSPNAFSGSRIVTSVNSVCPYCTSNLARVPKRKTACPSCGEFIFVRKGELVTAEGAAKIDGLSNLERLGVTSVMFNEVESELTTRFGHRPSVKDVFWGILNRLVVQKANSNDLSEVYREMVDQLRREGKDPKPLLRQALELELRALAADRTVKRVTIVGFGDDSQCRGCASLDGKEFGIDEAMRDLPAPTHCTSEEGCRCGYTPVFGEYEFTDEELKEYGTLTEEE